LRRGLAARGPNEREKAFFRTAGRLDIEDLKDNTKVFFRAVSKKTSPGKAMSFVNVWVFRRATVPTDYARRANFPSGRILN
jgi:hypothetical protein